MTQERKPIWAQVWRDGGYRNIFLGQEIPPEEGYLDLQDDLVDEPEGPMTAEERDQYQRDAWIAKQQAIEIEKREPLAGQQELFNEPGPEEFRLTGQPKSKRRKA